MLHGLDQATGGEEATVGDHRKPGGQMQPRQPKPPRLGLCRADQGTSHALASGHRCDSQAAEIKAAALFLPQNATDQVAIDRESSAATVRDGDRNRFGCLLEGRRRGVDGLRQIGEGCADQGGSRSGVGNSQGAEHGTNPRSNRPATVAERPRAAYVARMSDTPAFLDAGRPGVPDIVVPRGVMPFYLPDRPVRGRLIRLGPLADALLMRRDTHPAVTRVTGQAMALVAALAAALKFRGSFSLQAKGDGAISMLLADCTDDGALRGYALTRPERLDALLAEHPEPSPSALLGQGYLAFTIDQGPDTERHQGIVAITGETLSDMALHYFETSEQLRCTIRLACDRTEAGWRASALILERIAGAGGIAPELNEAAQEEAWNTAAILAATLTDAELLDDSLPPETLLYRLFHTEGVAVDLPRALAYGCRCSRARLSGILEGFSTADLDHMAINGDIVMTCEFCNFDFRFPRGAVQGADIASE